jgi:AMMECR1 domain-containing protein
MRRSGRSGLLLPQVATEQGWNREEFLVHTCRKAGLADDAWRERDTVIEIFTAIVFGEEGQGTVQ